MRYMYNFHYLYYYLLLTKNYYAFEKEIERKTSEGYQLSLNPQKNHAKLV